uniref:TPM domain-containing protein n=1 Tax=Candidatus Enterococcus willemsii TaxID=1857215 RepID=UPI00403F1650
MKKILTSLFVLLGFFLLATPVHAQGPTVTDEAGLFTEADIQEFNQLASELNSKIKGEVFIVTSDTNNREPRDYADDLLRERVGNDNNGSLLLLDMNQREIYITTSGNMIDYLNDKRIESLLDDVYDGMSTNNFSQAAKNYLIGASRFVDDGVPKDHYRIDEETGKITYYKVLTPFEITLALIGAAVISLIFFFIIKSKYQLKMGTYRYPYQEKSSLQLSTKQDRLINSFVTTRRIPKPSSSSGGGRGGGGGSTTHSSGGGTFGGGGRSF